LEEKLRKMQFMKVVEALKPVLQESFLIGFDLIVTDKQPHDGFSFVKNPYEKSSMMVADERSLVVISQREDGVFVIHDFVKILGYHIYNDTFIPHHTQLYERVAEILEELGEREEILLSKLVL